MTISLPFSVGTGHLGLRNIAQFAAMNPATFAGQRVHVDQGNGTFIEYLSTGLAWTQTLTPDQVANVLLLSDQPVVQDQSAVARRVQGIFYPGNDGSGTTLAESGGFGPAMTAGGTTTGVWANAGWFTHDAAGNTLRTASSNVYVDSLIDQTNDCAIIIGMDIWYTAWPTATECMFSIGRIDSTYGGFRMPVVSASPGRFGLYYKPNNGGAEAEQVGYTIPSGYLGVRNSVMVEIRFRYALSEVDLFLFVNGVMQNSTSISTSGGFQVVRDSNNGLNFSGYSNGSTQKLGTSGAGTPGNNCRTANMFCFRHSGTDRNIAGQLASYVAANQALPSWLTRV